MWFKDASRELAQDLTQWLSQLANDQSGEARHNGRLQRHPQLLDALQRLDRRWQDHQQFDRRRISRQRVQRRQSRRSRGHKSGTGRQDKTGQKGNL